LCTTALVEVGTISTPLLVLLPRLAAYEGPGNMAFECLDVVTVELRGVLVEWVVWVRLVEEVDETVDDRVDVQYGLPVLAEDVQTNVPLEVDVRVKDQEAGLAVYVGSLCCFLNLSLMILQSWLEWEYLFIYFLCTQSFCSVLSW
jgi:hypothetical protein